MNKIAQNAVFTTLALALAYFEHFIPLGVIIPLPGIKLGIANIVILFIIMYLDLRSAFIVLIAKCFLASLLFGGITSLIFSVSGGIFAFGGMVLLKKYGRQFFTVFGIGMGGAAFHSLGQIAAASVIFKDTVVFSYLPVLLISSVFTGTITAFIAGLLFYRFNKTDLIKSLEN